jgi:hypothetical protein
MHPQSSKNALESLAGQPGWQLYCERVSDIVAREIDAKIFDRKTSDQERRDLVNARALLVESYSPEKIRQGMVARYQGELIKEAAAKT